MLGRISKIITTVLLFGFLLYALQWAYVIDRIVHICDHYPQMFADCREP